MFSFADEIDFQQICQQFIWSDEWKLKGWMSGWVIERMKSWMNDKLSIKKYCQQVNSSTNHQSILSTSQRVNNK